MPMDITVFPQISANRSDDEPWRLERVYKFLQIYLIVREHNHDIIHLRDHKGTLEIFLRFGVDIENWRSWPCHDIWLLLDGGGPIKIVENGSGNIKFEH